MAAFIKWIIIFMVALTMALSISITLNMNGLSQQPQTTSSSNDDNKSNNNEKINNIQPRKRPVSRFLADNYNVKPNPRASDHCHKDYDVCHEFDGIYKNSTCCNNKCVDLAYDDKNCGACKKKCKFTETCCRGECVDVAYDKRHCGYCNHRCDKGEFCVYGLCNYA